MYRNFLKPLFDFILVIPVLIILTPLLMILTIWLQIANKGAGAYFLHERPGKNGKIIKVVKFKTMTDERDINGKLLPDAMRLTKVGKFIRSVSLDELPQLVNVLKGEMSFVGPRPLLIQYLPVYNKEQARRHDVKPGITGWTQVNGRNANTWEKKFELDIWYVDNISALLDIKIIIMSVKKVLLRDGINKEGEATTVAFNGKN